MINCKHYTTLSTRNIAMKNKGLSIATMAMINVAAVVSLRGLAAEAEYGLASIFYYVFAAVCFLIPVSLVSAEMATGWPQKGGVFRWVGEAFNPALGFLAIWLQWIQNSIWFPIVLTFAAVSLAFMGPKESADLLLSSQKFYTLAVVLGVYWLATFVNFMGVSVAGAISKWGAILGTMIPGVILIIMGFAYAFSGGAIQMPMHENDLIPNLTNFNNLNLAVSIFLFYAGMEMSAVHIKDIDNPQRNYPRAIFVASAITVALFVLGTLALGFVIPQDQINLTQSLLVGYNNLFAYFGVPWCGQVVAFLLALGVFAGVSTWIAGPSKGVLEVGRAGYLPKWFQHTNKHGIQVNILLVQASIVTALSAMFVLLPSIQSAYQILTALTVALYLIMYILMFAAFLKLRIAQPGIARSFRARGGFFWAALGLAGCALALVLSYYPPSQIPVGDPKIWVAILLGGTLLGVAIPFVIYALRKNSWRDNGSDFEPFSYERKND